MGHKDCPDLDDVQRASLESGSGGGCLGGSLKDVFVTSPVGLTS